MSRMNNFATLIIGYTIIFLILLPFTPLTLINFFAFGLGYILLTGIFSPRWGLFLFLLTRPILDYFTEEAVFKWASYELNLAALWGIALLLMAAYAVYKEFPRLRSIPLFRAWGIFLLITILTVPFSIHTALSIREIIRILTIVSLFILGYSVISENKHFTTQIKIVIYSMLLPGAFAYYQFFTDSGLTLPLENIYNRIYGTFAHPNLFAYYLIIPLALTLIIVLIKKKKELSTILFSGLLAAYTTLLLLTYTRGAWIAFLLIIFVVGIFKYKKILVVAALIFVLLYTAIPTVQERANRIIEPDPYGSIVWRMGLWEDGWGYAMQNPWLGHGAGTAKDVILKERGEAKGSPHPHNDYLKILLEYGLLGSLAYLYLLISTLYLLWKKYRSEVRPNFKNIYLGIFALTLALFIMSAGDNMIRNTALQWALWSLIGGTLAVSSYTETKKS